MGKHAWVVGVCLVAVLALGCLSGCGKQPIAVVGQHKITRAELLARLEADAGRDVLLDMINRILIDEAFAQAGGTITPEEVQEEIGKIRENFPSPEAFAQALAARGKTEQDLTDQITVQLKVKHLCMKDVKVTEPELKEFFEEYRAMFGTAEAIDYSEIVVTSEDEAKKVVEQLKKPGASFGALAKQHSISPRTRERGGKVASVGRDQIYPEVVREAVLALEPGKTSAPIQAEGRWYIVKLDKIQPAKEADLKRDRARIEEAYKAQKAKQPEEVLREIRDKSVINIVDPKYADLNEVLRPKPELPQFGAEGPAAGATRPPAEPAKRPAKQPARKPASPPREAPAQQPAGGE